MYPAREQETPLAHTARTRTHTHKLQHMPGSGAAPGFVQRCSLGYAERRQRRKARGGGGWNQSASSRTAKLPRARRRPQRGRLGRGRRPGPATLGAGAAAGGRAAPRPAAEGGAGLRSAARRCRRLAVTHCGGRSPPSGPGAGSCFPPSVPGSSSSRGVAGCSSLPLPPQFLRGERVPSAFLSNSFTTTQISVWVGESGGGLLFFFFSSSLPTRSVMVAGHARTADPHTHTCSDILLSLSPTPFP